MRALSFVLLIPLATACSLTAEVDQHSADYGKEGGAGSGGSAAAGAGGTGAGAGAAGSGGSGGATGGSGGATGGSGGATGGSGGDTGGSGGDTGGSGGATGGSGGAGPCGNCAGEYPGAAHVGEWGCSGSACVIKSCTGGYANCNGAVADGCEVDVQNDKENCGQCSKHCEGGTCTNGSCTAFNLASFSGTARGAIDIDNTYVYYAYANVTDKYTIARANKTTGTGSTVASGDGQLLGFDVEGENVFYTLATGEVYRVHVSGSSPPVALVTGENEPRSCVAVEGWVYYTTDAGLVRRVPGAGGTASTIASGLSFPNGISTEKNDDSVYWAEKTGNIWKIAAGSTSGSVLASGQTSPLITKAGGGKLFFTTSAGISVVAQGGGSVTSVASGSAPTALAVDPVWVAWTAPNTVGEVQQSGGTPKTYSETGAHGVASEPTALYWVKTGFLRKRVR